VSAVLAYFNERSEEEVIVDPALVRVRRRDVTGPRNRPWGSLSTPTQPHLTPAESSLLGHPGRPFDACPSTGPR
jgi:hypothetical protein